jgi:hypothetical protein
MVLHTIKQQRLFNDDNKEIIIQIGTIFYSLKSFAQTDCIDFGKDLAFLEQDFEILLTRKAGEQIKSEAEAEYTVGGKGLWAAWRLGYIQHPFCSESCCSVRSGKSGGSLCVPKYRTHSWR